MNPLMLPVAMLEPTLDPSALTTRILENNLDALESLRAAIERKGMKDVTDVRDFGDMLGHTLLVGIEHTVTYDDLVNLIEHFRNGIASRRITT